MDVIQSRGIIGSSRPIVSAPPVELVFCNPDLLWRSEFPRPRLGQGAFREAFQAVHQVCIPLCFISSRGDRGANFVQAVTGAPYPYVQFGKPTTHTYDFAEKMLRARMAELHGPSVMSHIQPRLSVTPSSSLARWFVLKVFPVSYMIGGRHVRISRFHRQLTGARTQTTQSQVCDFFLSLRLH